MRVQVSSRELTSPSVAISNAFGRGRDVRRVLGMVSRDLPVQ